MPKLEDYKPQLKDGKLIPKGEKLIYENASTKEQATFPLELIDFLSQCNGDLTVSEIIENIYYKNGTVQFRNLYNALLQLKKQNFLENPEQLNEGHNSGLLGYLKFLTFKPIVQFKLSSRLQIKNTYPLLFYMLAMGFFLTFILSLQNAEFSWLGLNFIRVNDSFLAGILFMFIGASLILTVKSLVKIIMLLLLVKKVYDLRLVYMGYSLHLKSSLDSLGTVTNRFYLILFHITSLSTPFALIFIAGLLFPNFGFTLEAYSLATLLLILELNPYENSEMNEFVKSLNRDDTLNKSSAFLKTNFLASFARPFESKSEHRVFSHYARFSVLWTLILLLTVYISISTHMPNMLSELKESGITEALAILLLFSFSFVYLSSALINFFTMMKGYLFIPISHFFLNLIRIGFSSTESRATHSQLQNALEEVPFFSQFPNELLSMIVQRSQLKQYKKNAPVILQGDSSTHLFVLLAGHLTVRKRYQSGPTEVLSTLKPISVFGENSIIDNSPRTSDILCENNSLILQIPAKMLQDLGKSALHSRQLNAYADSILVHQYFSSAPIFRNIHPSTMQLFVMRGEICRFEINQIVYKQGDPGDSFYLLLKGSVASHINEIAVSKINQGGFFGETSLIGNITRTSTTFALEPTQVLKISKEAFWDILSRDLTMAMFIEAIGESRIREDIDTFMSTQKQEHEAA